MGVVGSEKGRGSGWNESGPGGRVAHRGGQWGLEDGSPEQDTKLLATR